MLSLKTVYVVLCLKIRLLSFFGRIFSLFVPIFADTEANPLTHVVDCVFLVCTRAICRTGVSRPSCAKVRMPWP